MKSKLWLKRAPQHLMYAEVSSSPVFRWLLGTGRDSVFYEHILKKIISAYRTWWYNPDVLCLKKDVTTLLGLWCRYPVFCISLIISSAKMTTRWGEISCYYLCWKDQIVITVNVIFQVLCQVKEGCAHHCWWPPDLFLLGSPDIGDNGDSSSYF